MGQLFKYMKLFGVQIMHRYYRNFQSPDLVARPSQSCIQTLSGYGLRFRRSEYGFDVFADTGEDQKLKKAIDAPLKFSFYLDLINNRFLNFSSLPLILSPVQLFYFSNKEVNQVDVFNLGKTELLINKGQNVTENDLVKCCGNNYHYSHTAAGESKTFRLIMEESNLEVHSEGISSSGGIFDYFRQMNEYPMGLYRLEVDGTVIDRFFFSGPEGNNNAFAVVEIFTTVPAPNKFIVNQNEISTRDYKIVFLNRSTRWRYKVTNKNGITLANPAIAVGNDLGQFSQDTSLVFVSNQDRELKEEAEKGIRLLKDSGNLTSEVLKDLPNPSTDQVIPVKNNGSYTVYSDIFIYL